MYDNVLLRLQLECVEMCPCCDKAPSFQIASIPVNLLDPLLAMSWEDADSGTLPTIFVGIVDDNYTDVMFEEHANRLKKLFTVNPTTTASVKIIGIQRAGKNVVDDSALVEAVKTAKQVLNHLETKVIHIVGLGRGSAVKLVSL